MKSLLRYLGYRNADDLIEFLMCGTALLPAFLMICGEMLLGSLSLLIMICLLAAVGSRLPPPEPQKDESPSTKNGGQGPRA